MPTEYDAVVVGSGPNGLAAAITMARAGCSVLVCEANATIGGGARSAELTLPGFVHDVCSAAHPLAAGSPFFRTLPLQRFGLEWIQPEIPLAHPLDDGSAARLYKDVDLTADSLGIDGPAYRRLMKPLALRWQNLANEFLQPMLHFPQHPITLARFGIPAICPATFLAKFLFRHAPGIFKIDYALSEPVPWKSETCHRAGTIHLGGGIDEIAAAEREVARGTIPERPFLLVAQQSLFDSTRAPRGQHTLWGYCD